VKYFAEEEEMWPIYSLFTEQAPESEEPRLEVDIPEELALRIHRRPGSAL
jgi:hypothetical protein